MKASFKPASLSTYLKALLPSLSVGRYKGQNGKIAVLGGSVEYTGAPFYAAKAALRAGADLSHVFTPDESALIPIKCYSPELIVHLAKEPSDFISWTGALHSVIIGPGLGRNPKLYDYLCKCLSAIAETKKIFVVGDADFLFHLSTQGDDTLLNIVRSMSDRVVLTPNVVEFSRLCDRLSIPLGAEYKEAKSKFEHSLEEAKENSAFFEVVSEDGQLSDPKLTTVFSPLHQLSAQLNGATIINKGAADLIYRQGGKLGIVATHGSRKRCGGIGDVLTGVLANFAFYQSLNSQQLTGSLGVDSEDSLIAACMMGCMLTREASRRAFETKGIALITPDILNQEEGLIGLLREASL